MNNVFIFSLPRSGSTLLQRLLLTSDYVVSPSETWFFLLLSEFGNSKSFKKFDSSYANKAFNSHLNNNVYKFKRKVADLFIEEITRNQQKTSGSLFVEKTPRNYFIIDFIKKLYPNSKFIFLLRNPVEIYSSIISRWRGNKFYLTKNKVDIEEGLLLIYNGLMKYSQSSLIIHYSDLIGSQAKTIDEIENYLEINLNTELLAKVELNGLYGDKAYKSDTSLENEILSVDNGFTTNWYREFRIKQKLNILNDEQKKILGYNDEVFNKYKKNNKNVHKDIIYDIYDNIFYR